LVVITVSYVALVAGHKAGLIYNTFPLMNGQWIPDDFLFLTPWLMNFVQNPATLQLMHRFIAILTWGVILNYSLRERTREAIIWAFLATLQGILGVLTLLYGVPVLLGTLHQGIGALLFAWTAWLRFGIQQDEISIKRKEF